MASEARGTARCPAPGSRRPAGTAASKAAAGERVSKHGGEQGGVLSKLTSKAASAEQGGGRRARGTVRGIARRLTAGDCQAGKRQ